MPGPRVTNIPDQYDAQAFRQVMRDLDNRFAKLEKSVGTYTVSNFSTVRTLNMATATATDIGNFLATLVSDLKAAGRLGG